MKKIFFIFIIFVLTLNDLISQTHKPSLERVDASYRRRTEIDGNNVRTSVFNFCFSGRTGGGQGIPYEWPKNTGRVYVALVGLFVGAEVRLNDGSTARIVDLPTFRQSPLGESWNMEPLPGYFNLEDGKISKSDEPTTWPSFWPDKIDDLKDPGWRKESSTNTDDLPNRAAWNGYFGKNQFSADQEMFYRVGDDNYNRPTFNYTPDTTDITRKGLGLIIDSRVMEWSQVSVSDAVFFIHEVKNDGTKNLNKVGVSLWLADFVGGDGDSQDDKPDFDLIRDIAFSFDNDGVSSFPPFQGTFVGAAATLYLETPGNATDRVDNDGDGETGGDKISSNIIVGEISGDLLDNNSNGLIDEDSTHIPFGQQVGVSYADGIDNNSNGEVGSPVVTNQMIAQANLDDVNGFKWKRWPSSPERDTLQNGIIHLITLEAGDLGKKFADNIDNNNDCKNSWPLVTKEMVTTASTDLLKRFKVPNTKIILYDLDSSDIGKKYINIDGGKDGAIDENIDEMMNESRDDGIDNDNDWNILTDDVGLDGSPGTGDLGEGDGKPTSGRNTQFPGEPNIDKVDVSEADQIGLTNVQYKAAGAINFSTTPDIFYWAEFLIPGKFVNPAAIPVGESDLFVSSGLFPLKPGQIERISYSVVFGNAVRAGNADISGAKADALRKREYAQLAYNEDYQFAQAPLEPTLTAVASDKKVTLYWNDIAEKSIDRFLQGITGANPQDFEGYKIYRSTDPAFEDARIITDAYGSPAPFLKPIVTFDKINGIKGFHPVAYNGVQFDLGNDLGIVHSWVDTTVQNGQKYYYAIRAYDQGFTPLNIAPSESNLKINFDNLTGKIKSIGTSVAIVTPEAPVAGYENANFKNVNHSKGSSTGKVFFEIIDQTKIKDNHKYSLTFADTVISGGDNAPDTFRTKNYTLKDITDSQNIITLINKNSNLEIGAEQPLIDGFRIRLFNETTFGVNKSLSRWSSDAIYPYLFEQWIGGFTRGLQKPSDYKIIFGNIGIDTSKSLSIYSDLFSQDPPLPSKPVNFKVINSSENKKIDFAFWEFDLQGGEGALTGNNTEQDIIVFFEKNTKDSLVSTWKVALNINSNITGKRFPTIGDTLTVVLSKIFSKDDVFEFSTVAQKENKDLAKSEMNKIKVVPNPYISASTWEERNPFNTGRGPRTIHFTHLPKECTIRIYTINGELVNTINHNSSLLDGTAEWNLLTRDNLSASYGIYIYHIDAPEIGEKIGKFAIIK